MYRIGAAAEQVRPPRLVRIAMVQNGIIRPTTDPVKEQVGTCTYTFEECRIHAFKVVQFTLVLTCPWTQVEALHQRILHEITEAAYLCGTNVICYQEAWSELHVT